MSLFQQFLVPKIPLLLKSLAVSIVIAIYRKNFDHKSIVSTAIAVFQVLSILSKFSNEIFKSTEQGIGYGLGQNLVGGNDKDADTDDNDGDADTDASTDDDGNDDDDDGNDTEDMEGRNPCPSCKENPYSIESLKKLAIKSLPPQHQETVTSMLPKTLLPNPEPAPSEIIKAPQPVRVFKVGEETVTLCQALIKAGFDPTWTIQDVRELKQTKKGKARLNNINKGVVKLTGMKSISNKDIVRCFPHYFTDYICRKTVVPVTSNRDFINSEELTGISSGEASPVGSKIPRTEFAYQNKAKHCNLDNIRDDIHKSVAVYYAQTDEGKAEAQINDGIASSVIVKTNYVTQRALLEIKNLINLFQNKSKNSWFEFVASRKIANPHGFGIKGTKYHIPWDLFYKHSICFGY